VVYAAARHAQAANPRIIVEIQSASMETDPGKGMQLRGQRDAASFHVKHPPKTHADQDSQAAPPRFGEAGTSTDSPESLKGSGGVCAFLSPVALCLDSPWDACQHQGDSSGGLKR